MTTIDHSRVPAPIALASLPIAFVSTQLGGTIARSTALWMLPDREWLDTAATLVAMGATSLALLLVAVVTALVSARDPRRVLTLQWAPLQVYVAAAVGTVALGPLGDLLMQSMAAFLPKWTLGSVSVLHGLARSQPIWLLWPFFALLPGVAEEAFFRGMLQGAFRRPELAIAVGGAAFALFHLDPHHVVGVLPLGLFLSWVAQRHGLSVTVVAHVVNNTVALTSAQVAGLDVGYGTDTPLPFYWVPAGLVVAAFAMWVLRPPPLRGSVAPDPLETA